ncbi:MAG: DinB family protein [Gemmatimonadetes bacterium]|nr:DinB family protein [Gemmatimonadota bacterium]
MSIAQLLLDELDREVEASRTLLDRLPEGKWGWRPHEKSMTLGRLAAHVAEIPSWSNSLLMADEIDFMSPEMQAWTPREMQSKDEILAELESAAETCRGHLEATSDEDFDRDWTMKSGDQVVMQEKKYMVFRRQVLNHMVHHRAQLGVFLRLLDVPLPGSYGPSADEGGGMGE